jgi:hypothetical protein
MVMEMRAPTAVPHVDPVPRPPKTPGPAKRPIEIPKRGDLPPNRRDIPAKSKSPSPATKANGDRDISELIAPSERTGEVFANRLEDHIQLNKGQYVKDEDGSLHLILSSRRIVLDLNPENHDLAELMINVCHVSTLNFSAKSAIQRLQVTANRFASRIKLRKFSALSQDGQTLYVPMNSGKLLQVTADGISEITNGSNADSFWVEHPEAPSNIHLLILRLASMLTLLVDPRRAVSLRCDGSRQWRKGCFVCP